MLPSPRPALPPSGICGRMPLRPLSPLIIEPALVEEFRGASSTVARPTALNVPFEMCRNEAASVGTFLQATTSTTSGTLVTTATEYWKPSAQLVSTLRHVPPLSRVLRKLLVYWFGLLWLCKP